MDNRVLHRVDTRAPHRAHVFARPHALDTAARRARPHVAAMTVVSDTSRADASDAETPTTSPGVAQGDASSNVMHAVSKVTWPLCASEPENGKQTRTRAFRSAVNPGPLLAAIDFQTFQAD